DWRETMTRRQLLQGIAAMPISFAGVVSATAQGNRDVAYGGTTLPAGIRSRLINNVNGITYHVLEAGFEGPARPCVLLIHGFPELAYSWRRVILPLARALPFNTASDAPKPSTSRGENVDDDLAKLPVPRKYYQTYYTTRPANENMWHPPQGIHNFLRAYYHFKSADFKDNKPFALTADSATEMSKLPRYYVMDLNKGMAETVSPEMPSASAIAACKWLPEEELRVYSSEYGRTGFQGGLNSYRVNGDAKYSAELQ